MADQHISSLKDGHSILLLKRPMSGLARVAIYSNVVSFVDEN
jgi:hypothetical protein